VCAPQRENPAFFVNKNSACNILIIRQLRFSYMKGFLRHQFMPLSNNLHIPQPVNPENSVILSPFRRTQFKIQNLEFKIPEKTFFSCTRLENTSFSSNFVSIKLNIKSTPKSPV
jgi:hypothetical protein